MENHERFMALALEQATAALHNGEFPVGCVISDGHTVVATGARTGSRPVVPDETSHAEIVALKLLSAASVPVGRNNLTLYSTLEPCLMCFGAILIHGIRSIVYACEDAMGGGTGCDLSQLPALYHQDITIVPGVLREKSLSLFKAFFSDPANAYLRSTPLAAYMLAQ